MGVHIIISVIGLLKLECSYFFEMNEEGNKYVVHNIKMTRFWIKKLIKWKK